MGRGRRARYPPPGLARAPYSHCKGPEMPTIRHGLRAANKSSRPARGKAGSPGCWRGEGVGEGRASAARLPFPVQMIHVHKSQNELRRNSSCSSPPPLSLSRLFFFFLLKEDQLERDCWFHGKEQEPKIKQSLQVEIVNAQVLLLAAAAATADKRDVESRERPLSVARSLHVPGQPTHRSAPSEAEPCSAEPSLPAKAAPLRSPCPRRSARLPASRHLERQAAYCRQPAQPRYPGAGGEGLKQWEVIEVGDICVVRRLVGVKYMLTIGERSPSQAACLLFLSFVCFY